MAICSRFYVASNLFHLLESNEGDTTWWCVSKDCQPGDLGYVYWKKVGIKVVFEFVDFRDDEGLCKSFGMPTATVNIVKLLEEPITFQDLKRHRTLNKTVAVRRNFQARWFDVEAELVEELQSFINEMVK